jgi:NADP-dependent 3-hydroxy acid dehydrogenase YdfG
MGTTHEVVFKTGAKQFLKLSDDDVRAIHQGMGASMPQLVRTEDGDVVDASHVVAVAKYRGHPPAR